MLGWKTDTIGTYFENFSMFVFKNPQHLNEFDKIIWGNIHAKIFYIITKDSRFLETTYGLLVLLNQLLYKYCL